MTAENVLLGLVIFVVLWALAIGYSSTLVRLRGRPEELPQAIKDECYQEVDGFWVYGPVGFGYFTPDDLRSIASYLDQQNRPYEEEIAAYFRQDREDNPELYRRGQGRDDGW